MHRTDKPTKRPPGWRRNAVCPAVSAVRRLVVERGHLGVTNELIRHAAQVDSNRAGTALCKLTNAGEICGVSVAGVVRHWFANQELAQRWQSSTPPQVKATPQPRDRALGRPTPARKHQPGAGAGASAPVVIYPAASTTDQVVTHPTGVHMQRLATLTHDPRYQCAPGERPWGAGFAAAGIGRDVTTGQEWERRA